MKNKNKLYQCPYDKAVECDMEDPCSGCEQFLPDVAAEYKTTDQEDEMNRICHAHMKGQYFAGCKHPSWSEAFTYYKNALKPIATNKAIELTETVEKIL